MFYFNVGFNYCNEGHTETHICCNHENGDDAILMLDYLLHDLGLPAQTGAKILNPMSEFTFYAYGHASDIDGGFRFIRN